MEIAMIHVRHLSELATWQFRCSHDTQWVLSPKDIAGCIKTRHPRTGAKSPQASAGLIGSAYNESTSINMTVSRRSLSLTIQSWFLHFLCTRRTTSYGARGNRAVHIGSPQQLPAQVVHIKKQNGLRVHAAKLLLNASFPSIGEIGFGLHVLGKEATLM